jgi:hypothetical protein
MFLEDLTRDIRERRFAATTFGGFNTIDLDVLDAALIRLEQIVKSFHAELLIPHKLVFTVIEFSRNDYLRAFKQFSPDFMENACFIYLDTEIDKGKNRVYKRISKRDEYKTKDDHFVS